jgi:hypothetical protein
MRCEVVHTVPGRLRLRYPAPWLKSRHASVEHALRAIPGVRGVAPRATTGSVLIEYDPFRLAESALLEQVWTLNGIHGNVSKALRFLLATNLSELLVTAGAIALGVARPMSALQFLWINLLSDVAPALALAVEPPEADVMAVPPRDPAEPILSRPVLGAIGRDGAVLAATALAARALVAGRGAATNGRAGTIAFSTLTTAQLLHALAYRTPGTSDRTLLAVVGSSIAVQGAAMLVPPLRRALGLVPLGLTDWGVVAAAAGLSACLPRRRAAVPVTTVGMGGLEGPPKPSIGRQSPIGGQAAHTRPTDAFPHEGGLHGHAEPNGAKHDETRPTND